MAETVYWQPEARKDLDKLSQRKQDLVTERVDEFSKEGTSYKQFGRVTVQEHSFDKFKIKVKETDPFEINQRVIIGRYQKSWVIWGLKHRENVYESEFVEEIIEREY